MGNVNDANNIGNAQTSGVDIEISVPTIFRDCTGGRDYVTVQALTVADALQRMRETYRLLRIHLYEETGKLRPHVQIFYNDESTRWLERLDVPIKPGDRLEILQAVSGG